MYIVLHNHDNNNNTNDSNTLQRGVQWIRGAVDWGSII